MSDADKRGIEIQPAFRAAGSDAADWRQAVADCVERLGPSPAGGLGVVYATDAFGDKLPAIVELLTERTGVNAWVGTVGFGVIANNQAYYDRPGLAVMLAPIKEREFALFDCVPPPPPPNASVPPVALVHMDPRSAGASDLLKDIARGSGAFLVGGSTAARGDRFDQVAGMITDGGVSGVVFAPGVAAATGLSQGCAPIGPTRRITRVVENIITEIDGAPALEALRADLTDAGLPVENLRRMGGLIFAGFPVSNSDTGDYVVANLVGVDEEKGWIAVAEDVGDHDSILFCRRDRIAAEADLTFMARRVRARAGDVRGAVYVTCLARGPHTFASAKAEVALLQEALGDAPLVGFFANGEISQERLYRYTGVLTVF
ncbi:MAG: FIST signal transduction protein [Elsteraceae bacterium]